MTDERFNVVVWWPSGGYSYVDHDLGAKDAVLLAKEVTETRTLGGDLPARVVITDEDDCTVFLWEGGEVVWPTRGETQ